MSFWRGGARTPGWWVAAIVAFGILAADLIGQRRHAVFDGKAVYFMATMAVALLVGLWAWAWRTPRRMGKLMFWWPALLVAGDLLNAYPDSRIASTIGLGSLVFGYIVFAQMALSYPTGTLMPGRLAWAYIFVLGYAAQVVQNAVNLLYYDARGCPFCVPRSPSILHVGSAPFSLDTWNDAWFVFILAILPIGIYLLCRAYLRASPGTRRSLGPVVVTGTLITCTSGVYSYVLLTDNFSALAPLSWVQTSGDLAAALTALVGLAVVRHARGSVGRLVVELDRAGPGGVRRALARAIGDPSLELALWLPDRRSWVDEGGQPVTLPQGGERAVTLVGDDLAAMIHDRVLLDQPALLESVGTAARLALENERLQAELRAQLAQLRTSRARIVRAGDEERRKLERDLHDGAQQRLLSIGMALQLLRSRVGDDPDAAGLLEETGRELQDALQELRELARGIHPAVLTDHGLASAVRTLAERAPIPVDVRDSGERFPPHVETAAYFVVSEALANVVKHAQASRASVTIESRAGVVILEVVDDGIGGAREDGAGSGLRGLADRIGALDGRLSILSPDGGGTRLRAEISCES